MAEMNEQQKRIAAVMIPVIVCIVVFFIGMLVSYSETTKYKDENLKLSAVVEEIELRLRHSRESYKAIKYELDRVNSLSESLKKENVDFYINATKLIIKSNEFESKISSLEVENARLNNIVKDVKFRYKMKILDYKRKIKEALDSVDIEDVESKDKLSESTHKSINKNLRNYFGDTKHYTVEKKSMQGYMNNPWGIKDSSIPDENAGVMVRNKINEE